MTTDKDMVDALAAELAMGQFYKVELMAAEAEIARLRGIIAGLECEHDGEYIVCFGWPNDNKRWELCQVCKAKREAAGHDDK